MIILALVHAFRKEKEVFPLYVIMADKNKIFCNRSHF
jgi:hypothetical protein